MTVNLASVLEQVLSGTAVTRQQALALSTQPDTEPLCQAANRIREHFRGRRAGLCSIMNARSGLCEEDCKYCAQSAHHGTGVQQYPLVSAHQAVELALSNQAAGVHRFSLVTSGRSVAGREFEQVLEIYRVLKEKTRMGLCASLGCITEEQARQLKDVGVFMYHHNLETSRRFFPNICTTHTYDDRLETIHACMTAGLEVCSGGILGLGETMEDRVDMALDLRALGVRSVPLNLLFPVKGTPLEDQPVLSPPEFFRSVALFRFILPDADLRYAGGRANLGEAVGQGYRAGINTALVGNLLTTTGKDIAEDLAIIRQAGLEV